MKKIPFLFAVIISWGTVFSQTGESPGTPVRLSFSKYELSSGGAFLLQSETPTCIKVGQDSVKFYGGFTKGFGIKQNSGFIIETWEGWSITLDSTFAMCQSPGNSIHLIFKEPVPFTTVLPGDLQPNTDISKLLLMDDRKPDHNVRIYKPSEEDIPYMPVYKPDSAYNGFLLIADGRRYEHNPQNWIGAIKNNLYQLRDSLRITEKK